MKISRAALPIVVIAAVAFAGCGSDSGSSGNSTPASGTAASTDGGYGSPPATDASAPATAASAAATDAAVVAVGDSALGPVLTGADGLTLYAFTKDGDGLPTCTDGCAAAWPPVIVDASIDLSALPSTAEFTVVARPDGSSQLAAGGWPLYTYAGDAAAGDTTGQGSGGVWFVVAPDGTLIK